MELVNVHNKPLLWSLRNIIVVRQWKILFFYITNSKPYPRMARSYTPYPLLYAMTLKRLITQNTVLYIVYMIDLTTWKI